MLDKQAIRKLVEGWFSGKQPEVATNYETWAVHQWLTAAGSGAEIRHQAKVTDSIADLPTKLYDYFNDMVLAKDGPSWRSDLLVKGLGRVNWDELAEALRQ